MNKPVVITADSTADLSPELLERYHIKTIPLTIILGEESYADGADFSPEMIYSRYHADGSLPKTAAPGIQDLSDFFSAFVARGFEVVHLDISAELSNIYNSARLAAQARLRGESELFTGIFHRRVGEAILRRTGSREPSALAKTVKDYRLTVLGPGDVQNAQVTRGGADVKGFDPLTLESRRIPGLYCVGEALDVDGRCGGYNLHWAFASGLAAGRSAAL